MVRMLSKICLGCYECSGAMSSIATASEASMRSNKATAVCALMRAFVNVSVSSMTEILGAQAPRFSHGVSAVRTL